LCSLKKPLAKEHWSSYLINFANHETFIFSKRMNVYEAKEGKELLKKILKLIFKSKLHHHHQYSSSSDAWKRRNHYKHNNLGHHHYKKKYKSRSFFSS
jgi:hypothetical protein